MWASRFDELYAEKESERNYKSRRTAFKVAGVVAAVGAVTEIIVPYNMLGFFMIEAAAVIAFFTVVSKEDQEKKRKKKR